MQVDDVSYGFLIPVSFQVTGIASTTEVHRPGSHRARLFILCVLVFIGIADHASAQPQNRTLGVGGMVGRSAGIAAKLYIASDSASTRPVDVRALDFSMSWTADDVVLWTVHMLTHRTIPDSPLSFFIGPGAAVGLRDSHFFWGLSSNVGIFFEKKRFEVFLQISPRLVIVPELLGEFGSAVGLRYYL